MAYGIDQFSKNFFGTLQALSALEASELQNKRARDEMEREKQADIAYKETLGRAGQADDYTKALGGTQQARMLSQQGALTGNTAEDIEFERASAAAAQGAMRENAVRQGAIPADAAAPELTADVYSTAQAAKDYKARAAGIGRKYALEAAQLGSAMRSSEQEERFFEGMDKLTKDTSEDVRVGEVGSMEEVYKHGLKAGVDLKYNDKNKTVALLNSKGETVKVFTDTSSLAESIAQHRTAYFFEKEAPKFVSSPKEAYAMWNEKRRRDIAEREWEVKEPLFKKQSDLIDAQIKQTNARASSFEDKLSDGQKLYLGTLKSNTEALMRAASTDPTPQNTVAAQRAQFNLFNTYKKMGMPDIDPYQMSGIPTPEVAAKGILGDKPAKVKDKVINEQIGKAEQLFGKDYAAELRSAIDTQRAPKRNDKGEVVKEAPAAAPTRAIGAGRTASQSEFESGRIESVKRAIETETNPRRRLALQNELKQLEAKYTR